jgi:hypothetical protein
MTKMSDTHAPPPRTHPRAQAHVAAGSLFPAAAADLVAAAEIRRLPVRHRLPRPSGFMEPVSRTSYPRRLCLLTVTVACAVAVPPVVPVQTIE